MKWFRKSLIRQIGTILIGFIVLAFVIYGTFSIFLMRDFFESNSKNELSKDALFISNEIDNFMEKNIVVVNQMKTNQNFQALAESLDTREEKKQHPLYAVVTRELQAIKDSKNNISMAYIAVAKTNDLISSTPEFEPAPDYNLNSRSWYTEMMRANTTTVTSPYINQITKNQVVTIATPVYQDNTVIGALAIDLPVEDIANLMDSYKVGKNGYTFLMNKDGTIFYQPKDAEIYLTDGPNPFSYLDSYLPQITSGGSGIIDYQSDHDAKFIAYAPTRSTNLIVATVIPQSEVLAPVNQFLIMLFFIGLILLLLLILYIRKMTRLVSEPIVAISESVADFSVGGSEITLSDSFYSREDELGILSSGLNKMSQQINNYIKEIENKNSNLNLEISRRKEIQTRMKMILKLLSGSDEGIFILDHVFNCIFNNASFSRIIGIPKSEFPYLNLMENQIIINQEIIGTLDSNSTWTGEIKYTRGTTHILLTRINKTIIGNDTYYIGNITDLTAFKKIEKDLYYLKYFDHLTGLNSKLFMDEAVTAMINEDSSHLRAHALILINIDDFRIINEAKGFEFGNKVLVAMANRLKRLTNEHDILARLSNDEFGILKKKTGSNESLYDYILKLSNQLEEVFHINDETLSIAVSMGISLYPGDASHYSTLLECAISALNNVKSQKGVRFEFYDCQINSLSIQKYETQIKLRNALNNNELLLYYQPQIDFNTGQIVGLEALIRWMNPEGIIPPDQFISIAEESTLIFPIGKLILDQACEFGRKLLSLGYEIPIAVNLSCLQFKAPYIIDLVQSTLSRKQLPPQLLELEITEGILMSNEEECENILKKFKDMGIQVSIDDFGTGYSSLNYLKKFEVDKIKIDRSFIKDIPQFDNGTIAKIIIELADNFKLQVIAEGVETKKQLEFLLENNCHIIQGYYYAKPLSEDELLEWIKTFHLAV